MLVQPDCREANTGAQRTAFAGTNDQLNQTAMPAKIALVGASRRACAFQTSRLAVLADTMYDVLEPRQLLDVRTNEDGTKDYLVQWPDDTPDSWVRLQDSHIMRRSACKRHKPWTCSATQLPPPAHQPNGKGHVILHAGR